MAFNKAILIGNLTADPELKNTASGVALCNFTLAVNRKYSKQGEQAVDYINVCAWRASAEFVGKYARKGNALVVCGQIQTRNYTNAQGQKVYITEVVADEVSFAGNGKNENNGEPKVSTPNRNYTPTAYDAPNFAPNAPVFEEIPDTDGLPF